MYTYEHPRPSVTVDVAIFKPLGGSHYRILLIRRAREPFKGKYALPGGFINLNESLENAARRELFEETGIQNLQLIQIQTFSKPDRDPRGHVISTCFGCVLGKNDQIRIQAGDDAADADWFGLGDLPPLAFDHSILIESAANKLLFSSSGRSPD